MKMKAEVPIVKEVIRIVSEHKQKKSRGQVEAIVRLSDGSIATRHVFIPIKEAE